VELGGNFRALCAIWACLACSVARSLPGAVACFVFRGKCVPFRLWDVHFSLNGLALLDPFSVCVLLCNPTMASTGSSMADKRIVILLKVIVASALGSLQ
jgi:hypothetical protein